MTTLNVLTVVSAEATYEGASAPIEYQDYVVDGRRLRDLLTVPVEMAPITQETTLLCPAFPRAAVEQIDKLLLAGDPDFEDGRIGVLLSPVCGDTGCGAVSARITADTATVTWQDFGWQDGFTEEPQPWLFEPHRFTFDRDDYSTLMRELRDGFTRLVPQGQAEVAPRRGPTKQFLQRWNRQLL
jgi:hypothetical protein